MKKAADKERKAKAYESKAKGRNSKWEAYHGKRGALSPGGFVLSPLHSGDVATADPVIASELTKSQVKAIFSDFSNVFELLDIPLGLIHSQPLTERGQWLTNTLQDKYTDLIGDDSLVIEKINSNADLIRKLTGIKSTLLIEGFLEEDEALPKHSTKVPGN